MERIDQHLFPTLVSIYRRFLNPEQLSLIYDFLIEEEKYAEMGYGELITVTGKSSFTDRRTDILKKISNNIPECSSLFDSTNAIVKEYGKCSGTDDLEVTTSWFNIQPIGDILKEHSHGHSVLSASIYVNVDENSSPISFRNPNPVIHSSYYSNERSRSPYLFDNYWIKPEAGDFILFPGWLWHGSNYEVNNTPNRMCIGLNGERVHECN